MLMVTVTKSVAGVGRIWRSNRATICERLHLRWCLRQDTACAGKLGSLPNWIGIRTQNRSVKFPLPGAVGWWGANWETYLGDAG